MVDMTVGLFLPAAPCKAERRREEQVRTASNLIRHYHQKYYFGFESHLKSFWIKMDRLQPDLFLLRMEISVSTVPDKLKQAVPFKVKAAESFQSEHN